jgi:hypothetical protein
MLEAHIINHQNRHLSSSSFLLQTSKPIITKMNGVQQFTIDDRRVEI